MKTKTKYNTGKLRWRNFPLWLLEDLIKVASMGEEKYGTYDFLEKDYTVNDHLDAAKRHMMRYENPHESDLDDESNISHLFHCAWRCIVAAFVAKFKPHLDDRYKVEETQDKPQVFFTKHSVHTRLPDGTFIIEEKK